MKVENYFKKNGVIYGISSVFKFGWWKCYVIKFDNLEKAQKWLNEPEGEFRERELCTKSQIKHYLTFMDCNAFVYQGNLITKEYFLKN